MDVSGNLEQLVVARRLMLRMQQIENRRKGKQVENKSIRDEMEEDQALLSGEKPVEGVGEGASATPGSNLQLRLKDLFNQAGQASQETNPEDAQNVTQTVQINVRQVVEREASLTYTALPRVDGLVRRSQTLAETDRYRFDFSDGTTFKITDKWSGRSTTIWGDPHVDVDDVEGNRDGEFSDLKGSDSQTTLMLQDGSRVTFTAKDNSIIEGVDIFKDGQHLGGIGAGSVQWNEKNGLFGEKVDSANGFSSLPTGDTVYAGGDGNDWFSAGGQLLWGKTTGPAVVGRPAAMLQMEYRERITQQVSVQVVNKQT